MAKRKLTRRQAWRINKIQEERVARAQRKANVIVPDDEQQLGPEQHGLVIANYGATLDIEAAEGALFRCSTRQNIDLPVVGDQVVWQAIDANTGIVTALLPRHNVLARPDIYGKVKALAANIDQMLIVAAPRPQYSTYHIDQYLVAAEVTGIHPLLVFNKIDLIEEQARESIEQDLARYAALGYRIIRASAKAAHGLEQLTEALSGKTSVFVGQSGVGKSSLINHFISNQAAVGPLSETTGLGQHTTSATRIYHLPCGGKLIDSPGVREFRLWQIELDELEQGFIEFRPHLGHCKFRDCRHLREPGCALLRAVEEDAISRERLGNFYRLRQALEENKIESE